jgi:GNAT superfamily N-acetyltransferase
MPDPLTYISIKDVQDDLLLPWLDLYETAFPPAEKVLVSWFLKELKDRAAGLRQPSEMLAVLDGQKRLVAMADYELRLEQRVALLWYLAVGPVKRGQGVGSSIYREIVRRARDAGCRALLFEVEIPEEAPLPETRRLADSRIMFYRKLGARLLGGVHYLQYIGQHQPPLPMHIMVQAFETLDAREVFDLGKLVFNDALTQTGDLELV